VSGGPPRAPGSLAQVSADVSAALDRLLELPGVADAVTQAREACTQLRWHPALRRRTAEAAAESRVRAARSSAALDGARLPVAMFRDAVRGAQPLPDDPVGKVAHGALRAVAETEHLGPAWQTRPGQVMARLHLAAATGVLGEADLGRPRLPDEPPREGTVQIPAPMGTALRARLQQLADLLAAPPSAPALLVAALVHAEVMTARPFAACNGVVARALARAVIVTRGLDPYGIAVWEAGHLASGPSYPAALAGYASGRPTGIALWLKTAAKAIVDGAGEGSAVCDAVVAGRFAPGPVPPQGEPPQSERLPGEPLPGDRLPGEPPPGVEPSQD